MNKQRRKAVQTLAERLEELKADIEAVLDEEQECFDNMPEAFQEGERGGRAQEIIEALEEAINSMDEAMEQLEAAVDL